MSDGCGVSVGCAGSAGCCVSVGCAVGVGFGCEGSGRAEVRSVGLDAFVVSGAWVAAGRSVVGLAWEVVGAGVSIATRRGPDAGTSRFGTVAVTCGARNCAAGCAAACGAGPGAEGSVSVPWEALLTAMTVRNIATA